MADAGREFFKMCGSGNDFVFFDARRSPAGGLESAATIATLCARGTGVGADGVVFLETSDAATVRMRYFNSDGSRASLCGNATLCAARLAVELGAADRAGFTIETDAGVLAARVANNRPEVELAAPGALEPQVSWITPLDNERRIGYAVVGVPHLVVLCRDADTADVAGRGRALRSHVGLQSGANVNFVAPDGAVWRIRTYERGVEAETLACGTGAAASAIVLAAWGLAGSDVQFRTRSGSVLEVGLLKAGTHAPTGGRLWLRGAARIVFRGRLGELEPPGGA